MRKRRTALTAKGLVVVGGAGLLLAYIVQQRRDPSACPYSQRFVLDLPRPTLTRTRLREMLSPEPGQRVLEVGPGTGYYSLQAARWLEPEGSLDILDIQQEMLDHCPDPGRRAIAILPGRVLRLRLPSRHAR